MNTSRAITPESEGTIGVNDDGRAVLRFVRHLQHPIDHAWAAVTEPAQMEAWLAFRVSFDARPGGQVSLWLGDSRAEQPVSTGMIEVCAPYEWAAGMDDGSTLRIALARTAGGCTLEFTDTRPTGQRGSNSVLAGWHLRMELLEPALEGGAADWLAFDEDRDENGHVRRIAELYWHYRNQPRDDV